MKKNLIIAGALAAVLCVPLAACGGSSDSTSTTTDSGSAETTETTETTTDDSSSDSEFDAASYAGEWHGSVEITGQTVYGTAGGNEQMEVVTFAEDGTVDVTPDPDHTDLLTGTGTFVVTDDGVTITMDDGTEINLTVTESTSAGPSSMTGNAADFGIADFDTIDFTFYG